MKMTGFCVMKKNRWIFPAALLLALSVASCAQNSKAANEVNVRAIADDPAKNMILPEIEEIAMTRGVHVHDEFS